LFLLLLRAPKLEFLVVDRNYASNCEIIDRFPFVPAENMFDKSELIFGFYDDIVISLYLLKL